MGGYRLGEKDYISSRNLLFQKNEGDEQKISTSAKHTTDDHKFAEMELLENELDKLYDSDNDKSELAFRNALKKEKKIILLHKAI